MAFEVGSVVARITADISDFKKGMGQARQEVEGFGSHLSNVGSAIAGFGKSAAIFTGVLGAAVGVVGKQAIDMAGNFEQSEIAFTTLLKDRAKAIAAIKEIEKEAKQTPYNLPDLIRANQLLISAGVSTKDAIVDIRNLGNAIAATGGGTAELNRLSVNLQQIKAVGKASALDIKQFAFAGINVYKLLAESTGKTVEQVRDMDVSYEDLSKAFAKSSAAGGLFEGAMKNQSVSLQGLMSNLQDVIGLTLKDIAIDSGLFGSIKSAVQALIPMIQDFGAQISNGLKSLSQNQTVIFFFKSFVATMQQVGEWIAANKELVITFLQGLGVAIGVLVVIGTITALLALLLNPLTLVALGIAALYTAWQTNFYGIRDTTMAVMNILVPIIQFAWSVIYNILKLGLALLRNDWASAWEAIKSLAMIGWNLIVGIFNGAVNFVKEWGGKILSFLVKPFEDAWNRIKELVNNIKDKLDFTKRHSPSMMDIINRSVALANSAFENLDFSPVMQAQMVPNMINGISQPSGRTVNQTVYANLQDGLDVDLLADKLAWKFRNS